MAKTALVTGITGQDGAYLARLLQKKGYDVHGLRQPVAVPDTQRLDFLPGLDSGKLTLHYADMHDTCSLAGLIREVTPDETYNLAAQSHVHVSFKVPDQTLQVNGAGTLRLLEAIRHAGLAEKTKFFQASTSELFGDSPAPQDESTAMRPRSPYAAAKLYAYHLVRIYREAYGMFACNGIMFNHESPLRGEDFVTRKIARNVAEIAMGRRDTLTLGNLDACRDWSHAADIMEGAWRILQHHEPDDFVLASGQAHSVRDFVVESFQVAGIELNWQGKGPDETAIDVASGRTVVRVDPAFFRPLEVEDLRGNPKKAASKLGWKADTDFKTLVTEMVTSELDYLREHA